MAKHCRPISNGPTSKGKGYINRKFSQEFGGIFRAGRQLDIPVQSLEAGLLTAPVICSSRKLAGQQQKVV